MALTAIELVRIKAIEELLNKLQIALSNCATKTQMQQLTLVRQSDIETLKTRVSALEAQVTALQGSLQ
jgi:polyhydroxyalkanoate synthesis regulator phasin